MVAPPWNDIVAKAGDDCKMGRDEGRLRRSLLATSGEARRREAKLALHPRVT